MRPTWPSRRSLCAAALAISACGRGRSLAPTAATTPDPSIPAGTVVMVRSGETDQPQPSTVVIAGRNYTTDAAGEVRLAEKVNPGTFVDIIGANVLDRQTLLRSSGETRFTVWPRDSPTGLNEHYTATLVYTPGTDPPGEVGSASLRRPRRDARRMLLVLSEELRADGAAASAHEAAVAAINAVVGDTIEYALALQSAPGAVSFQVRLSPSDPECGPRVRAFTSWNVANSEIVGGSIVHCSLDAARSATAAHEVGHTVGLRHSPDSTELMGVPFTRTRSESFGRRETLAMRLMLQRRGGNRFPDEDRSVQPTATAVELTVCR